MKQTKVSWYGLMLVWLLCAAVLGRAQQATSFTFTLDEPCKTSAAVYTPNGTLVRTLWSKQRYYSPGTYTAVWDGLEDTSNAAPAGTYVIKVLQHNTEYVWDGAIGNTSTEPTGPTVHGGFWPMADMAISGNTAFYVSGYNEGRYDFRSFLTSNPQQVSAQWYWVYTAQFNRVSSFPGDVNDLNWLWVAADTNWVYFACSGTPNPANLSVPNAYPGCIVACSVSNDAPAYFTDGVQIVNNGANSPLPNGIYVGTQPGLSGLAVQPNGSLLAVSVAPDNQVYLINKTSGAAVAQFYVSSPGRLRFSPDGSLWVISGDNVICYTNLGSSPSVALTLSGFSEPLDVAVNPTNPALVLVADGGASQQVKAFSNTGAPLWTYGLEGGYQANGPAVTTNKFWFTDGENDETFLSFAPDGSFWVGDGGNDRSLHFSASLSYIEQIMYQPRSLVMSVDQTNPSRVFNQFLEFNVDYTKPLGQGWTLVNNWLANVPPVNISWNPGLYEVTTFTNGRTYALVDNNTYQFAMSELCELTSNGLRLTGLYPAYSTNRGWISFGPDGSARNTTIGVPTWFESTLGGFDASNNPIWNPPSLIATASSLSTDPIPRSGSFGNIRATISSNNILISFDQSLNNGWHLGGINVGSSSWLWKVSPAVGYMNGCGTYEISNGVTYAGNTLQAVDRNVVYGYHGEFFRGQGQAGQNMHFYDDGLFVGQFGEASPGHSPYEGALPGFAGNGQCPNLIKTTNGDYYLWVNDESDHGPQRWHFVNAKDIRELTGAGTLGNTIALTNPGYGFPSGVVGQSGNQTAALSWQAVPGASSYNIRYSLLNGGPYSVIAGNTTNLSYVAGGLSNGQSYYFAVTAIQGGVEGATSEQIPIYPFDTTQYVLAAGSMTEGGQFTPVVDINSSAPSSGLPSYVGAEHYTGVLDLRELDYYGYGNLQNETVGAEGYLLYDWQGAGTSLANIVGPFMITTGSGWSDIQYLQRQYRVGSVLGVQNGLVAGPVGSIGISVNDANFHYLTVVSPAQFNDARIFTMRLTSTNGTSASYTLNETPGLSHVFQFLFQGNVTLTADASAPGGTGAIVQALFLDNALVSYLPASSSASSAGAPSTTTLASSQNPAEVGNTVTFTATVSGNGGISTGNVTFFDGATNLGAATLNSAGMAALSTSALSTGNHNITAVYGGDSVFGGSTSTALSQAIVSTSMTTLASSLNPAAAGSVVTFTATVSGTGGIPAGTVTFYDGNTDLGAGTLNGSGMATLSTAGLSAGASPHSITAAYGGSSAFGASSSVVLLQTITSTNTGSSAGSSGGTSATTLTSSQNPAAAGSVVTFTATVSGAGIVASPVSGYVLNGLVEWNKLNDGAGTVAADASGNGNTLPLVGNPVWGSDFLTLNGSTQYGDAGSGRLTSLDQHDKTICAWINKTGSSIKGIVDKDFDITGVGHGGWSFNVQANNHLDFWVEDGLDCFDNGAAAVTLGQWTFVAVAWHAATKEADFYINGVLNSIVFSGAAIENPSGSADLEVGDIRNNALGGLYAFDGSMHDIGIYNRVLSAAEIETNYLGTEASPTVSLPDLLYYEMTEYPQSNPPVRLADSSTHGGTTGTINLIGGLHWVTNVVPNNAIHWNGVNSYLDTSNSTLFNFTTNSFTINFWARPLTPDGVIMENGIQGQNGWYVQIGGAYQVYFGTENNGTDTGILTGPGQAQVNGWNMVTIVRSGPTTASIYINGDPVATTGSIIVPASSPYSLILGTDRAGLHYLDGDIWLMQIWGEALPATAIANLYFNQSSGYPWPTAATGEIVSGTVTFYDGSNNLGTGTLSASGIATLSTSTLSSGGSPHSITAVFNGNSAAPASSSAVLLQYITNSSATTLASSQNPALAGSAVTFTATVSGGGGTPAGTVTFYNGSTSLGVGILNGSGVATLTTSALSASGSPYSITAVYGGSSSFGGSTSSALSQTILNTSTTSIASSQNPASAGNAVTFTATVSGSGGTPSGTVTFYNGGGSLGTGALNGSGVATLSTSALSSSSSPYSITAVYGGSTAYGGSTSSALSQVILKTSTTTIASSQNPAVAGNSVTFTATVSGSGGTPAGTVTFFDGSSTLGSGTLNGSGVATLSTTALSLGGSPHSITAVYGGNSSFGGSTSSVLSQVILNSGSTSVVSSQNPALAGSTVTFTATVVVSGGTPTGTVTFYNGGTSLGSGTLNGSGVATLSTSALPASGSPYSITAVYGGSSTFAGSTSSVLSQIILYPSTTTVASSQNPSLAGSALTLTATVSSSGGAPSGTVTFFAGSASLGAGTLNGSGVATLSTSSLSGSASPYSITAVYGGNSSFGASTSAALSQTVLYSSTTSVTSSQNPALANSAITFTATVSASGGTPTGTVAFFASGTSLGSGTLSGSDTATLTTSALSAIGSPFAITAVYSGNSAIGGSTSGALSEIVTNLSVLVPIPLVNASFESPAGAQGTVPGLPTGWVASVGDPYGVYNPPAGMYSNEVNDILPSPAQGSQVLYVQAGNYIAQFLTNTLAGNQTYVLSGAIGNRGDGYGIAASDQDYVDLVVGNTIIAANTNLPHPAPGGFLPWAITYTSPVTGFPSGTLQIRLGQNGTGQVHYDNIALTVGPASASTIPTTTTIASSLNPALVGSTVTFTATVSGSQGIIPAGTVNFFDGSALIGSGSLNNAAVATFNTSALAVTGAPHPVTAVYAGSSVFSGSSSSALSQIVLNPTTTTLASSQNPALASNVVSFTATVIGSPGAPTGTVFFYDGTTNLGSVTVSNSGVATFNTAALGVSTLPHSITAVYGGDNNFSGSTSSAVLEIIQNPATVNIPLVNPGFESPAGAQGTVPGLPTGWVASIGDPYGVYNPPPGLYTNEVNDILPSPAQGSQVLYIQGGNYIAQFLTNTLAANQTYTLSGAIGNRGDGYGMLSIDVAYVDLVVGNTIVAANTNLTHPAPGGFLPWTITYTTPATGFPTGTLQIRLGQNGVGQVHYDNIILTVGPAGTPNP